MRAFKAVITACCLLFVLSSMAFSAVEMPTWPQSFAIQRGETAGFAVPLAGAGSIEVALTWQGEALNVTVKDADGKILAGPSKLKSPSAKARFDVSSGNGSVVVVSLSSPDAARRAGEITVTYPGVDSSRLESLSERFNQTKGNPANAGLKSSPQVKPVAYEQTSQEFGKDRESKLSMMKSVAKAFAPPVSSSLKSTIPAQGLSVVRPGGRPGAGLQVDINRPNVKIDRLVLANQQLTSVQAAEGKPGTGVDLAGKDLMPAELFKADQTADDADLKKYWDGAMFHIAPNVDCPAAISWARRVPNGTVYIRAIVPNNAAATSQFDGTVYLYNASNKTNTVPFKFLPSPLPKIKSMENITGDGQAHTALPANTAGAGDFLILDIDDFHREYDTLYLDMGGSATRIAIDGSSPVGEYIYIPDYTSSTPINAKIYAERYPAFGGGRSEPFAITLLPSVKIDSIYYVSGSSMTSTNPQGQPGDPIVITGGPFVDPEVHFVVDGKDLRADVESSDINQVRVTVPDFKGIAGDVKGSVYVVCGYPSSKGRKSSPVSFLFHPTIVCYKLNLRMFTPYGGECIFANTTACDWWNIHDTAFSGDPKDPNYPPDWFGDQLVGRHLSTLVNGFKQDDIWFPKKSLKNNYKIQYIDLTFKVNGVGGGARLDAWSSGTSSPYAKIHWWVEPCSDLYYYVTWYVRGPWGCDPF